MLLLSSMMMMKFWSTARRHHRWDRRDKPRMTRAEMLVKCHTTDAHPSLNVLDHIEVQLLWSMELQLLLRLVLPVFVLIMMMALVVALILSWVLAAHRVTIVAIFWGDDDNLFAMIVIVAIFAAIVLLWCIFVVLMPARPLLQHFHLFLQLMVATRRLLFSKTVHHTTSSISLL